MGAPTLSSDMPTYDETASEMRDIRESVDRLRKREGEFTEEERADWGKLTTRFTVLATHKESLERDAAMTRMNERLEPSRQLHTSSQSAVAAMGDNAYDVDPMFDSRSAEDLRRRNPWNLSGFRNHGRGPEEVATEYRSRAIDAMSKMVGTTDAVRGAATGIVERWDDSDGKLSRLSLALSDPAYFRSFSKSAKNPYNPNLSIPEQAAVSEVQSAARAMSLTDAAGGYLVPMQLDPTVIQTAAGVQSGIRSVATQVVATGDKWYGISSGDPVFSWDAESTASENGAGKVEVSDDSTVFGQPTIDIHKSAGFIPISLEALADGANVASTVATLLVNGRTTAENVAFATGSGVGMPRGIITALTGTSAVVPASIADTFHASDLYALDNALAGRFRGNASFLANKAFYNLARQLDEGGGSIWTQLGLGLPPQLIGYRVVESEAMDATPTSSSVANYAVVLGDMSYFYIADRIGFTVEFIPQLFGPNGRPTGQRGWYGYFRTGSDVVNPGAFKMLNI